MPKTPASPLRVGLIGCGNISNAYFRGLQPFAQWAHITACADLDPAKAQAKAAEHGIATVLTVDALLASPEIDIVLNLTVPQAHVPVNLAALRAGKHVYCEKPFSLSTREGRKVLAEADQLGLRVGCAPDTVLGSGIQTCRKIIDDHAIGRPIAAVAHMLCHGHESWHPSPEFYYQEGGGPLFDMGPYYLTALVTMLGPARSVSAMAATTFPQRTITSQPLAGKQITVRTPTHITGSIEFASGALATITMSFDVWQHHLPLLEIFGAEGSLSCPDPNTFAGPATLWTTTHQEWTTQPPTHNTETTRGFGLADMAHAILKNRPHRASGQLGLHIVEIMESLLLSAQKSRHIPLKTTCPQPAPVKPNLPLGELG